MYQPKHALAVLEFGNMVGEAAVEWLVPGRIPFGCLTVLDGDPGQGKSFLTLELAAAVSRGYTLGPKGRVKTTAFTAGNVLIMNAEDEVKRTMVPRLRGLQADMQRIIFCGEGQDIDGRPTPLYFPEHIECVRSAMDRTRARLLIIDPIMAFLSPEVRRGSDQSVRHALAGLKTLAEEMQAAVLMVRHLNKSGGTKVIYRGGGSIGIVGLTRSALYVGPDPDDRDRKLLAPVKNNLAPLGMVWAFDMVARDDGTRKIRWLGESEMPLSRILETPSEARPSERCARFLTEQLGSGRQTPIKELMQQAKKAGLSFGTLMRVKKELGVECVRLGRLSYWTMAKKKGSAK